MTYVRNEKNVSNLVIMLDGSFSLSTEDNDNVEFRGKESQRGTV